MMDKHVQFFRETTIRKEAGFVALVEAANPYILAVLIMSILMSIWIGFRAT